MLNTNMWTQLKLLLKTARSTVRPKNEGGNIPGDRDAEEEENPA